MVSRAEEDDLPRQVFPLGVSVPHNPDILDNPTKLLQVLGLVKACRHRDLLIPVEVVILHKVKKKMGRKVENRVFLHRKTGIEMVVPLLKRRKECLANQ